jgi:hypothetical protein
MPNAMSWGLFDTSRMGDDILWYQMMFNDGELYGCNR